MKNFLFHRRIPVAGCDTEERSDRKRVRVRGYPDFTSPHPHSSALRENVRGARSPGETRRMGREPRR